MNRSILVIGDLNDIEVGVKYHFSLIKGLYLAEGFSHIGWNSWYASVKTDGESKLCPGVHYIPINKLSSNFLTTIDVVVLIREMNIPQVFDGCPPLMEILKSKGSTGRKSVAPHRPLMVMKGDTVGWLNQRPLQAWVKKHFKMNIKQWGYMYWDAIYCQTPEYTADALKAFGGDPLKKLFTSRMAVPNHIPELTEIPNPYSDDHSYCVAFCNELKEGRALLPLKLCPGFDHVSVKVDKDRWQRGSKKRIIYTGRIRTDGGKIAWMIRDIADALGPDYEFHVFPGRFNIPGLDFKVFSPKNGRHLQLLRDTVFANSDNVIIHHPYSHQDRFQWLYHADYGLDFSSTRPDDRPAKAGNAKLLDYCASGLPVVTEKNAQNWKLVQDAGNGIIIEGIGTVSDYVEAFRKLETLKIDRECAKKITVQNNNHDLIAEEIQRDLFGK